MIEESAERIEAPAPEFFIVREPHRCLLHGVGKEFDAHDAALFLALHEPGVFEHAQVLDEAGQRHAVRVRKLRHAGRALQQLLHDVPARRVGERPEHAVEGGFVHPFCMGSGCSMDTRFFSVS